MSMSLSESVRRLGRLTRGRRVASAALLGGVAAYLLAHVAFRLRNIHTLNSRRLGLAIVLLALVPLVYELKLPALGTLAILVAALVALIAYETHIYGEARARIRNELRHGHEDGPAPAAAERGAGG